MVSPQPFMLVLVWWQNVQLPSAWANQKSDWLVSLVAPIYLINHIHNFLTNLTYYRNSTTSQVDQSDSYSGFDGCSVDPHLREEEKFYRILETNKCVTNGLKNRASHIDSILVETFLTYERIESHNWTTLINHDTSRSVISIICKLFWYVMLTWSLNFYQTFASLFVPTTNTLSWIYLTADHRPLNFLNKPDKNRR